MRTPRVEQVDAEVARAARPLLDPGETVRVAAWATDRSRPAGLSEMLLGGLARRRRSCLLALTPDRLLVFDAAADGAAGDLILDEPLARLRTVTDRTWFGWTTVEILQANGKLRRFDFPASFADAAEAIGDALQRR